MGERSILTVFIVITDNRIKGGCYKGAPLYRQTELFNNVFTFLNIYSNERIMSFKSSTK